MKLYMFRTVPLSIIRSLALYTQQWYMLYRFADSCVQDQDVHPDSCKQDQDVHPDPARKLSANLYSIYLLLYVQWKTLDDGQRNCPKHVEFHSKNKFEK